MSCANPGWRPTSSSRRRASACRTSSRSRRPGGYLSNHKALAKVFRAKLLVGIEAAGLALPRRHPEKWVVDCKSVGSGEPALIYLGRYFTGESSPRRISSLVTTLRCASVIATPRPGGWRGAPWLVLQHLLPKGFRRARNFGFLHPNCKRLFALLHLLLKFAPGRALALLKERAPILCSCCGALMVIVKTRIRSRVEGILPVPIVADGVH